MLKDQTIKGIKWKAVAQAAQIITQFIVTLVLARLLTPGDFGEVALALVFIDFGVMFGDMGLGSALIQRKDVTEDHFSTAFWSNIIIGIGLMALLMLVSPLIAGFFHKPQLQEILMVLAFQYVIISACLVQDARLQREMEFQKISIWRMISIGISGALSITAALRGWGVWSLVLQAMSNAFINTCLLWLSSPWRPKMIFSRRHIMEILPFGLNIMGAGMVSYFSRNVDKILIGRFLGVEALGLYTIAYKIMMYPIYHISWLIDGVMFSAYSKIHTEMDRLRAAYQRQLKGISLGAFPLGVGFAILAPYFVTVVYGPKWEGAIPLVQVMSVGGVFMCLGSTAFSLYAASGRADIILKTNVINSFLTAGVIGIGIMFNLNAVAMCYTVYLIIWSHLLLLLAARILKVSYLKLYKSLMPAYGISLMLAGMIWILGKFLPMYGVKELSLMVAVGMAAYIAALLKFRYVTIVNRQIKINI